MHANLLRRRLSLAFGRGFALAVAVVAACTVIPSNREWVVLVSSEEDTLFLVRERRLGQEPDAGWEEVGRGATVRVALPRDRSHEIAARADGFRERRVTLVEPVPRQEFRFLEVDRIRPRSPVVADAGAVPGADAAADPAAEPAAGSEPAPVNLRHALVIGISTYQKTDWESLRNARRDAERFAAFLASPEGGNLSPERVHLLVDEQASRDKIVEAIQAITAEANEDDLIILFFAGHGRPPAGADVQGCLVPFDGTDNNPVGTCLEKGVLADLLDRRGAKRQLLLIDCCFAGGPAVRSAAPLSVWGEESPPSRPDATRRVVITSTRGDQLALDDSPFTQALLDVLENGRLYDTNGDGAIDALELYNPVTAQVRKDSDAAGGSMSPQLFGQAFAAEVEVLRTRP